MKKIIFGQAEQKKIAVLGAGNIGASIARGLAASGEPIRRAESRQPYYFTGAMPST
ncbi:MAG: NAD(P)-binding domain-containing protein [Elusimicrobiaceae bacterium]|nr:NAD(P)-binding domain-containing protein [Elusimicrobiaceae bacterium]